MTIPPNKEDPLLSTQPANTDPSTPSLNKQSSKTSLSSNAERVRRLSREFCYGFSIGFGLKASANALFFLLSMIKNKSHNINQPNIQTKVLFVLKRLLSLTIGNKAAWHFGNVFGCIRFLYSYLSSIMDNTNNNNNNQSDDDEPQSQRQHRRRSLMLIKSVLKGLICGSLIGLLSIFINNNNMSKDKVLTTVILFCSGRMIDDVCRYLWPSQQGWYHRFGPLIAIFITMSGVSYPLYYDPSLLNPSYYRNMLKWGRNTEEQMIKVYRTPDIFYPCYPHWHSSTKSCLMFSLQRFIPDLISYFPMYGGVHGLSFILHLIRHGLRNQRDGSPMNLSDMIIRLYHLGLSVLKSSLFLATLQHTGKVSQCWIRDYLKSNYWMIGTFTGGMGGVLGCLWENRSRRMAYVFYTWMQTAPIFAQLIDRHLLANVSDKVPMLKEVWHVCLFQCILCAWAVLKDRSDVLGDPLAKQVLSRSLCSYFI